MIDELRQKAAELGIKVDGRWKEDRLLQVIADASDEQKGQDAESEDGPEGEQTISFYGVSDPTTFKPLDGAVIAAQEVEAMNAYALRIWSGQSVDMPKHERIERVKAGLTAQGWGDVLGHLSLPNAE